MTFSRARTLTDIPDAIFGCFGQMPLHQHIGLACLELVPASITATTSVVLTACSASFPAKNSE